MNISQVIVINDYLLGTMAGGAADCTYWLRILSERYCVVKFYLDEKLSTFVCDNVCDNVIMKSGVVYALELYNRDSSCIIIISLACSEQKSFI